MIGIAPSIVKDYEEQTPKIAYFLPFHCHVHAHTTKLWKGTSFGVQHTLLQWYRSPCVFSIGE